MGKTAILSVRILADALGFKKGTDEAETRLGKFEKKIDSLTVPAAAVGGALIAMGSKAGEAASKLQQSSGAVESVFKTQAAQIEQFAASAAQNLGLSANEYQEMASVMGAQLKNLGVAQDDLVGRTDSLIQLGSDLAATFGGTTSDAVVALSALLRGERDPIERFGVSIKQADIDARVAAMGLNNLTGEAAKQAETQAMLSLLYEQTADAQGQFAREVNSEAGARQILNATYEDSKAKLGEALLPIMTQASQALTQMVQWVGQNSTAVLIFSGVIGAAATAILGINAALKAYRATMIAYKAVQAALSAGTKLMTASQVALNVAMYANPVGLVIAAVVALIGTVALLYYKFEGFRNFIHSMIRGIVSAFDWLYEKISAIAHWISETWNNSVGWVVNKVSALFSAEVEASLAPVGMTARPAAPWSLSASTRSSVAPVNVTINGALDPVAVAKQIRAVLRGEDVRDSGGVTL